MANDKCVTIRDNEVSELFETWHASASNAEVVEVMRELLGSKFGNGALTDAEKNAVITKFRDMIERYCVNSNGNVTMPTASEVLGMVHKLQSDRRAQENRLETAKSGRFVVVGEYSSDLTEVTRAINDVVEFDNDYSSKGRTMLITSVETMMKTIAKQASIIQSEEEWNNPGDNQELKPYKDFVKYVRDGKFSAKMDDLFKALVMASSIYVERDRDGNITRKGLYYTLDTIIKALDGNEALMQDIRNTYENRRSGTKPTGFELEVMDALVTIYSEKNGQFYLAMKNKSVKNFRAASGSSRSYRVFAKTLRDMKPRIENDGPIEIKTSDYADIRASLTFDNMMRITAMLRGTILSDPNLGVDFLNQLIEWMQKVSEDGKIDIHSFVSELSRKMATGKVDLEHTENYSPSFNPEPTQDGQYTKGLTNEQVYDILEMMYREAFASMTDSQSQDLLTMLVGAGTRQIHVTQKVFPYAAEMQRVLNVLRNNYRSEDAATDHPDINGDTEKLSPEKQVLLDLTSQRCSAEYDTPTLRARVNSIANTLLAYAEKRRGPALVDNKAEIKRVKQELMDTILAKKRLEEKQDLTEEEEAIKKELNSEIMSKRKELALLRKSRLALLNRRTMYQEILKNNLSVLKEEVKERMTAQFEGISDEQAYEAEKVKILWDDLLPRAFAQIEAVTGISITYNRDTNSWEASEPQQQQDDENQEDSEDNPDGSNNKSNDDYVSDDIDPYAHLTQNVRVGFALLPIIDPTTKEPVTDIFGIPQYYDPKGLYYATMSMHDGLVTEPEDFVEIDHNLDDEKKRNPEMYREEDGKSVKKRARTDKEAFPYGKPKFPILEANKGRYPWVKQLIQRLTEDYMEMQQDEQDRNMMTYGQLATDLYCQMGFNFTKRAIFKANTRGSVNPLRVVNTIVSTESVRRVQNRNYNQRIPIPIKSKTGKLLPEKGMIYDSEGRISRHNCQDIKDSLSKLLSAEQMVAKTEEEKDQWITAIHEAVTRMGYEINKALLKNEFENPTNEGLGRLNRIINSAKLVLNEMLSDAPKYGPFNKRTIYSGLEGPWRNMHDTMGFFTDVSEVQSTCTINGKAQQNFVAESAFSRNMNILTYGWKQMKFASEEEKKKLLKKRQEKIRKLYGNCFDDYLQNNTMLGHFYYGNDVEEGFKDVPTDLQTIGEIVLINTKDDVEFSNLSREDQAELELAGFIRAEQAARGRSALYRFPVPADSPVITLTSGTVMFEDECIEDLAFKALNEAKRIAHNRECKRHYVRTWAISRGRVDWDNNTYYDVVDKREREIPAADMWMWNRDKAIEAYIMAKDNAEKSLALQEILNLSSSSKTEHNGVHAWEADPEIEQYKRWRRWCPRDSFFTSEMKFRTIPNLETVLVPVDDVLRTLEERARKLEPAFAEEVLAKLEDVGRALSKRSGSRMRLNYILREIANVVMPEAETLEEALDAALLVRDELYDGSMADVAFILNNIAQLYTESAMNELYGTYLDGLTENDYTLLQFHRIASIFHSNDPYNNPGTDSEGNRWKVVQDTTSPSGFALQNMETQAQIQMTQKQLGFYENLSKEYDGTFAKGTRIEVVIADNGTRYSRAQVEENRPRLKNQSALEAIVKGGANDPIYVSVEPKEDGTLPTLEERTLQYLKLMFLNNYRHNTDLLELNFIDPSQFRDDFDLTKRLKGLMANGTRMNTSRVTADTMEYSITTVDDVNSISTDYAEKVRTYRKAVAEHKMTAEDAERALKKYRHQDATDGQGYITRPGYRRKMSAAGSANFGVQQEEIYKDLEKGQRHLAEDYDSMSSFNAVKQVGASHQEDIDPTGHTSMIFQYVKNSEGMMMQTADVRSPRSGRVTALEEFMMETEETPLIGRDGKPVRISTAQKASCIKSTKKGLVDLRYDPARVNALKLLADGKDIPDVIEGIDISKHKDRWRLFLQALVSSTGWEPSSLTFDAIDTFLHDGDVIDKGTPHKGLAALTKDALNGANEKQVLEDIEMLIALRNFMLPLQVTGENGRRVVNRMKKVIRAAVVEEGNRANDQYVNEYNPLYQHIQVRQSNHLVDSEAHLGSQISYIAAEMIDFNEDYEVLVNGKKFDEKVKGAVLYKKLYECLAARLVHGLNEYNRILTGKSDEVTLENLSEYLLRLTMSNPKFKNSDVWYALQVIKDAETGEQRFNTPLASVAIIYKISDILTSIVRNKTHRRPMKDSGNAVIEADELYEDQLSVRRDEVTHKMTGIECFLPAWAEPILKHCLVTKEVQVEVEGELVTIEEQHLDMDKLIGTGLETIVGYRIPTEDGHSCLPLIVKGFLPQEKGNTIVVSKDIITMSGSDNDIDKLFLMLRHIDRQLLEKEGKLAPVEYHWSPNAPEEKQAKAISQSDEQIENMIIDIMHSILTHPGSETRMFSPQNPNIYDNASIEIAYINLPKDKKLRYKNPVDKNGEPTTGTGEWVYEPENKNWDNPKYYVQDNPFIALPNEDAMKRHIDSMRVLPVQSLASMAYFHDQHTKAKTGIGIMANRMSVHFKVRTGLKVLGRTEDEQAIEMKPDKNGAVIIDGRRIRYGAKSDNTGTATTENVANTGGSVVDSGKSPALTDIGITLRDLPFVGFLLSCGLSVKQTALVVAIIKKNPSIEKAYYAERKKLCGKGKKYKDDVDLSKFTTAGLEMALRLDNVANAKTWQNEHLKNYQLMNVCHGIVRLLHNSRVIRPYEGLLSANSAKQGMSNDIASAVWTIQQVKRVWRMMSKDSFPFDVPQEMRIRNGLSLWDVAKGKYNEGGVDHDIAMWLPQMYHTLGIEEGLKAMSGLMFHASPQFEQLVEIFEPVWSKMSKDDGIKFIRRLYDHFTTFFLSNIDLFTKQVDADGTVIREGFVEMRNYFRFRFPAEFAGMNPERRAKLNAKYKFLAVLEFKEGRLVIDDTVKEGFTAEDIRQSLNNMAADPDVSVQLLAKNLFLCSYFTDGLRFGYGAMSNEFTAGFLAADMFKEYNEKMHKLATEQMTPEMLGRFALQFTANNAVDCQMGVLFRATKAYERGDNGTIVEISEERQDPAKDELTPKEIGRLEKWLDSADTDHRLYLDTTEPIKVPGKPELEIPKSLLLRLKAYFGEKPTGEFFRVQATYSIYRQNVYMIASDKGRPYVIKVKDFINTVWYNQDMDIYHMAAADTWMQTNGRRGTFNYVLTGNLREQNEDREKLNNNEPNPRFDQNRKKQRSGLLTTDTELTAGGWNNADPFAGNTDEWNSVMPMDMQQEQWDTPNLGTAVTTPKQTELREERREGDKTSRMSVTKIAEILFPEKTPDETAGLRLMTPLNNDSQQSVEEEKNNLLNGHDAQNPFDTFKDAAEKADEINQEQRRFIATVAKEPDESYTVELRDGTDAEAAEDWKNQHAVMVLTGDNGIDSAMEGIGNPAIRFAEYSDNGYRTDYLQMVDNLIDFLTAVENKTQLPSMSMMTARGIVRSLMMSDNRLVQETKEVVAQALNGNTNALKLVGRALEDNDQLTAEWLKSLYSISDNTTADEIPNSAVEDILSSLICDTEMADSLFDEYNMVQYKTQFMRGLGRMRRSLGDRESSTPNFTEQKQKLSQLKQQASAGNRQPPVSPVAQARAEEERRRQQNQIKALQDLYKIMRKALVMEQRKERILIQEGWGTGDVQQRMEMLRIFLGDNGEITPAGVVNYLYQLTKEYSPFMQFFYDLNNGSSSLSNSEKLDQMSVCLTMLKSHEELLSGLRTLMSNEDFLQKLLPQVVTDASANNLQATMQEMFRRVDELHEQMKTQMKIHAGNTFLAFVRDFVGDVPVIRNQDGSVISWQELISAVDGDISFVDQWMRSMGNTNDPIGQIFDLVAKKQKDRARNIAIADQQGDIRDLANFMTAKGLKDFEFMFEHDENGKKTGYYLSPLKWGQFFKELRKAEEKRDAVLKNQSSTQAERDAAWAEFDQWRADNDVDQTSVNQYTPMDTARWHNPEYDRLQADERDKAEFLEKFMAIKKRFDNERLGIHTRHERAIQRRMTSEQRFRATFTADPQAMFENVRQALASEYLVREDDYEEYGERSTVLDFEGKERSVIPAPFVRMLKNPDELSTDPIGCLIAYSYTSINFQMMKEIANPLEVAFNALVNEKVQFDEQSGRTKTETFRDGTKESAKVKQSRLLKKLRNWMDSQLYMRYLDDGGDTFKVFGLEFRKSKVINAFLRMSAFARLGFNWLVDLANLANGVLQTNIEVVGRKHFSGTQLARADKIYLKELHTFIPDLANPIKESKLALVGQLFNIMQNFDVKIYENRRYDLLSKMFNTSFAFLGTSGGNHWLHYRTAIAMMLNTEVTLEDGTKTNLWDALYVDDNGLGGKEVKVKAGAKINGELITSDWLHQFGRTVADVNQGIVGIYNKDDMMMAQRLSWARLFIAFRKHIIPLMDKRWRGSHIDELTGEEVQGYMRTFGELIKGIRNAQYNIPAAWNELSEEQKADIRMALMDLGQFLGLLMLTLLPFGGDDDDDEDGELAKICKYLIAREKHEMGSMLPTLNMPKEVVNMLEQPTIGTTEVSNICNFATTVFTPWTWSDKVQGGPFAGQTQLEMRFRKLPIPVLAYYRNIDKFFNGVDNSTWFYNRGYVGGTQGKV